MLLALGVRAALLAILLQALLPTLHRPASVFDAAICNAGGAAPASGEPDHQHTAPPCPICVTLQSMAGGFVPPPDAAPVMGPSRLATLRYASATDRALQAVGPAETRARGPPADLASETS